MSIFKRIFGKGDKESDNQVEKDIEQIKSGAIDKIYPILKPGNWVGIKAGALKQTIIGSQEEPQLVVAFGYDTPSNFVFLMPKDLEGKDPNKILEDAYNNLEEVQIQFEISEQLNRKVLTASGHDFSAEKILSKSHMMRAHELLNSNELLVSIPRRRCMMITSKDSGNEMLNMFGVLHNDAWQDESYGNAPIKNALFKIQNGQIVGMLSME